MGSCMDKTDADKTPLKLGEKEKLDGSLKLDKKKSVFDEDSDDCFKDWYNYTIITCYDKRFWL